MPLTRFKHAQSRQKFHFTSLYSKDKPIIYPPYEPASWQAEAFHKSDKHIKALFGGDRSGKTGTGAYEIVKLMRRFPGELFWTAAQTQDMIPAVWEWHQKFLAPEEIAHISWFNREKNIPSFLRLHNGSRMEYKSYSSGAGVFAAKRVKAIHLDEDPKRITTQGEKIFNDCLSRIIDSKGYILITATPILGKNWMWTRVRKGNQENRADHLPDSDIESWLVSLQDNKFIDQEDKDKAKGRMTKDEIDRRFYGMFTTLSGAVFKEFNEDIHCLREEPQIDAGWRRIRAIDLGYENPFCCLWIAQDEDGRLWVYDEYYNAQTLIKDHAANIEEITRSHDFTVLVNMQNNRPIEISISDHERQTRAELDAAGIYTSPAEKDVDLGIQVVNRFLMIKGDGRPSLFISPRCHNLRRQMGNYHYKFVKDGLENKEVIDKVDDHAVDPLRYGSMYFNTGKRNYTVQ